MTQERILKILLLTSALWGLFTLETYPFMHSDESWLGLLSQEMLHLKDLSATHPFFDLYPMHPHAIKVLFHLLQWIPLALFGPRLFGLRLLTYVFSLANLFLFYQLLQRRLSKNTALFTTLLLSVNVQWLLSAHLARQEMMLLFFGLSAWLWVFDHPDHPIRLLIAGSLIGLSIGLHPNAFLLCTGLALPVFFEGTPSIKRLVLLGLPMGLFALFYLGWSLAMDPQFFTHYRSFGATLGVDRTFVERMAYLPHYYGKLFEAISGTYFIPRQKPQLLLFVLLLVWALGQWKKETRLRFLLFQLLGLQVGLVLIGRFNQMHVVFLYPALFFLLAHFIERFSLSKEPLIMALFLLLSLGTTAHNMAYHRVFDYPSFVSFLQDQVKEGPVLANLNTGFALAGHPFYDVRNLAYLEDQDLTFEDYIKKHQIRTIVYYEEMDFYHEKRPLYNALYGNLYPYYGDMQVFLQEKTTPLASTSSHFAMRVVDLALERPYRITIYEVKKE